MGRCLAGLLALLVSFPTQAAEWIFQSIDDPSGFATGRIRYHSPTFDAVPDAYAAFTVTGGAEPRLFLFVRLPLENADLSERPSAYLGRQSDGRLEAQVPLFTPGGDHPCGDGQQQAGNCAMHCAVEKGDTPPSACRSEGGDPPWLQFRAEFDRAQIAAILDAAADWNALWFEGPQVFLPLDGLAEALCVGVPAVHPRCGEAAVATAPDAGGGEVPVLCRFDAEAGFWHARIDEVQVARKDVEIFLESDGGADSPDWQTSEEFSVGAVVTSYFHPSQELRVVLRRPMLKGYPVQEDVYNPYWAGLVYVQLTMRRGDETRAQNVTAERANFDGTISIETESRWLGERLYAGQDVELRIALKESLELTTVLPASGFAEALDEGFPAAAAIAANHAAGLCP